MSRNVFALSIVLALLAAGCVSSGEDGAGGAQMSGDPAVAAALARAATQAEALGCAPDYDPERTSANLEPIVNLTWEESEAYDNGNRSSHGEAELIHGTDLLLVSRYGRGGFEVVNVSDPYAPRHVVSYNLSRDIGHRAISLDVKVTTDGKTAVSGDRGAIDIIDISDPLAPTFEKRVPYPAAVARTSGQAHMLETYNVDGQEYVFAASQYNHGVLVFKMTGEPGARDLTFLTLFAPAIGGPLAAHDMVALWDPLAKKHLLWVANGFGGFVVGDISDPAFPVLLAAAPPTEHYAGWTHTVSVAIYGEKRYAATMAELGVMALKIYDVTDLTAETPPAGPVGARTERVIRPVLLGTWAYDETNPTTAGGTATQHNTQIVGDFLYMAHYGQGFFRFNLREFVDNVGPLPAQNIGLVTSLTGGGLEAHGHFQNPDRGMLWETVVVNGIHYAVTSGGPMYVVLDGCLPAGNVTVDRYH